MIIKNIVFDVGNVLVRWEPLEVIQSVFPKHDPSSFLEGMRPIWIDLNLGKLSEREAIDLYQKTFKVPSKIMERFIRELKLHQTPLEGSIELLRKLRALDINLFSITDNVKEIMEYHMRISAFPKYFKDIIVSADIGVLKPDPKIYLYLLSKNNLDASETLFIDDIQVNVEGAIKVGMHAFQFTDYPSCTTRIFDLLN